MKRAKIYKPSKTSMQSGRKKAVSRGNEWLLEYPRSSLVQPDTLMGWQSSTDTNRQVRINFPNREAAIAYAEEHLIAYDVSEPKTRQLKPRTYADNFSYSRRGAWTH